jgi:hypothetical protein
MIPNLAGENSDHMVMSTQIIKRKVLKPDTLTPVSRTRGMSSGLNINRRISLRAKLKSIQLANMNPHQIKQISSTKQIRIPVIKTNRLNTSKTPSKPFLQLLHILT